MAGEIETERDELLQENAALRKELFEVEKAANELLEKIKKMEDTRLITSVVVDGIKNLKDGIQGRMKSI